MLSRRSKGIAVGSTSRAALDGRAPHRHRGSDVAGLEETGRDEGEPRPRRLDAFLGGAERALDLDELTGRAQAGIGVAQAPRVHRRVP